MTTKNAIQLFGILLYFLRTLFSLGLLCPSYILAIVRLVSLYLAPSWLGVYVRSGTGVVDGVERPDQSVHFLGTADAHCQDGDDQEGGDP